MADRKRLETLKSHGVGVTARIFWNPGVEALYEAALRGNQGMLARGGALVVKTGRYTGRSPGDRFLVRDALTTATVGWGKYNQPLAPERFEALHRRLAAHLDAGALYVQDLFAGADPAHRLKVRVVTESPWHSLFARNMFIQPDAAALEGFAPEFTVLHAPSFQAAPERDGVVSEAFILVDFSRRLVLIGGTYYAGEIKKSVFGVLNYLLPEQDVLPMHCSANIGDNDDVAVFFGLSGTGKTTLSADGQRRLIGDDEHGWSDQGVFNFEGGCYAKAIDLDPAAEPDIYAASLRYGAILENVVCDPDSRVVDFSDARLAENTRSSYPVDFIPRIEPSSLGGHPANIIMLTADAFGVLPPVSELTSDQAMYHFLSGYTARVAGTERGVTEPQATFSTCFGAPFMPRAPSVYAAMLGQRIATSGARCWLVNTGWTGGPYGVGKRFRIAHTRAMVRAILDGRLAAAPKSKDPQFGLLTPESCPDVPSSVLRPRESWADPAAYDSSASALRRRFRDNFTQFAADVPASVIAAGVPAA